MALSTSTLLKTALCIFLLSISLQYSRGARILTGTTPFSTNQHDSTSPIDEDDTPDVPPQVDPTPDLPTDDTPTTIPPAPLVAPSIPSPTTTSPTVATGVTTPVTAPAGGSATSGSAGAAGGSATVAGNVPVTGAEHPTLSFFMHDIIGGSHAASRVVAGIVASSSANTVPFSTPNSQVFPITGGIPLNNINGIVNNNNLPFIAGFNGNNLNNNPNSNTVLQNTGNNNVANNLPFVAAGQLPAGITLQQLMFGSITVIDNELTEGHELGTGVIGRGQGFYLASSLDGSSHTFALTTLFHGGDHDHEVEDTISFFGVHRTASEISHIAVIGGTGKYEEAKGYATIESLPQVDEHTTDGVETIVHVNIYLTTP